MQANQMLQVSFRDKAVIYDLNKAEPFSVKEIAGMANLIDPQNIVDSGTLNRKTEVGKEGEFSAVSTGLNKIFSNNYCYVFKE